MAADQTSEFSQSDNRFFMFTTSGEMIALTCKFTKSKKFVRNTLCGFHGVLHGKEWEMLKNMPKCCRGGFIWVVLYDQHAKAKGKPLNPFCQNRGESENIYGDVILAQRYHNEKTIAGFTKIDHENILIVKKGWDH